MTFKVGDQVIYLKKFKGVVTKDDGLAPFPITVNFSGLVDEFTEDGKKYRQDRHASIELIDETKMIYDDENAC